MNEGQLSLSPTAEIITIGTEIVMGEIIDTNAPYIARVLREVGIDVMRTWSIADHVEYIGQAIREAAGRSEIIITTGGLGPTVDDPTREAAALAFGVQTEFRQELWEQVIERFARWDLSPPENNRRQARIPANARAIENPVGTAPAFMIEYPSPVRGQGRAAGASALLFCLPGVPREMEHLLEHEVLPALRRRFSLDSVRVVRVLHTAGVGESVIDERIGDLEILTNPSVGLAAHSGAVDVRISAKATTEAQARKLIAAVEEDIRQRLGDWIFGADQDSLASVAMRNIQRRGWRLCALEVGLEGKLLRQFAALSEFNGVFLQGKVLPAAPIEAEALLEAVAAFHREVQSEVALGVGLNRGSTRQETLLAVITPAGNQQLRLPYGGPPKLAARRAINYAMDLLRNL